MPPMPPAAPPLVPGDDTGAGETVPVRFTVLGVEPVRGTGRLVGLAVVDVDLAGVVLTLQGVQLVRDPAGRLTCRAPVWRHPVSGRWVPAVVLPPELSEAIAAEVLAAPPLP